MLKKVKAHLNIYRVYAMAQKAYAALPYHFGDGRALPPMRYMLHFTLRCNLNCSFCFITKKVKMPELTTEEWLKVIGQLTPKSVLTISGGEITLREDFTTLLRACIKRGTVNFLSNAITWSDELIQTCVDKKVFMIGVSIDGMRQTHDELRGKQGAFDKAVASLERLKKARGSRKYPVLDIKAMFLENNLDDLVELYKLTNELGADFLSLSFLKGSDLQFSPIMSEAWTPEVFMADYPVKTYFDMAHFERTYRELVRLSASARTKLRLNPEFLPERGEQELSLIKSFFAKANSLKPIDYYRPCTAPWTDMCIMPSGDVIPCLNYKVGNVREESVWRVWNGEKFRTFRKLLRENGILGACQTCCYCRVKPDALLGSEGPA